MERGKRMGTEIGGWTGKIYELCQWIARLAYLNILWTLFTLIGFVIFGLGPSTIAMYTIMRKWLQKENHLSVFSTFWKTYIKEFKNANLLGILIVLFSIFIYLDWRIISAMQGPFYPLFMGFLIGVLFFSLVILMYLLPLYVRYNYRLLEYFKVSFLLSIAHPFHTISMLVGIITVIVAGAIFTGAGILFIGSGICFITTYFSMHIFYKMEETRTLNENQIEM